MAIEPATSGFWLRYAHAAVGINTFGMSGPGGKLYDHFGFTTPKLVAKAHEVLDFYSARRADSKLIRPR
jgi:transketolase